VIHGVHGDRTNRCVLCANVTAVAAQLRHVPVGPFVASRHSGE